MPTFTPLQDLPVPVDSDDPDIPGDMMALALAVEKKLVGVYVNVADRDAKITAPIEGQFAVLRDTNRIHCYLDTAWVQVYPAVGPTITSGTIAPNNANGADGDVYFQVS